MSPTFSTHFFNKDSKYEELAERVQLVAYPIQKNHTTFQVVSVICYFVILFLSYTFIFQPQYQPPQNEIYTDAAVVVSGTLSGYILERKDGSFVFIDESGFEMEMKKETVDQFVSDGFEIRKE